MGIVTTHTAVIDDREYTTKTYPARFGLKLMAKAGQLIDPKALKLLVHEDDGGIPFEKLLVLLEEPAVIATLTSAVINRAAEYEAWDLPREFCRFVEGRVQIGEAEGLGSVYDHFDDHFAGRYPHMLKVVIWAARVGFGMP